MRSNIFLISRPRKVGLWIIWTMGGGCKTLPPPIHIRQKQPNRDRVKHVCSNSGLHGYNLFSLFSRTLFGVCTKPEKSEKTQIDSSTIDVNVEFVHSQYSYILSSQLCHIVFASDKIKNDSDNFRF